MHLHSSRTAACCVCSGLFPVRACEVWLPDLCAVWMYDKGAVWLHVGDGAGVRDKDTSCRIWSYTSHQFGTRHALNAKEYGKFGSRDRTCSLFKEQPG